MNRRYHWFWPVAGAWILLFFWRVLAPHYPVWLPYAIIAVTGIGVAILFLFMLWTLLALPEALFDHLEVE